MALGSETMAETALSGQTVVVIGGSAGIGLETARLARAEGTRVVLTGRNHERLALAANRALEVAPVRVNLIAAGFVDTPARPTTSRAASSSCPGCDLPR